jgi:phosphoserine phosphatase RsbU/P
VPGKEGNVERILIIEDEEIVRNVLKRALNSAGDYEILEAGTGSEGLQKARELIPDLILLDWTLPEMDGPEILKHLKLDSALRDIPVIMLTGRGSIQDRLTGLNVGANEYMVKPFDVRELILHIEKQLELARKVRYLNPLMGALCNDFSEEGIKKLGQELQLAAVIQKSLIPLQAPQINGLEIAAHLFPAPVVGGDFYDYIQIDSTTWVLYIVDIAGRGTSAALMMVTLRALLRYIAREHRSPRIVLEKLNDFLYENLEDHRLVTLFYSLIDIQSRKITFSDAGHVKPILIRKGSEEPVFLQGDGVPLGIYPRAKFSEERVLLSSGDMIIFYTDGLPSISNDQREYFGFDRINKIALEMINCPSTDIVERLLKDAQSFGAGHLLDDISCVVMKCL